MEIHWWLMRGLSSDAIGSPGSAQKQNVFSVSCCSSGSTMRMFFPLSRSDFSNCISSKDAHAPEPIKRKSISVCSDLSGILSMARLMMKENNGLNCRY